MAVQNSYVVKAIVNQVHLDFLVSNSEGHTASSLVRWLLAKEYRRVKTEQNQSAEALQISDATED